MTAFGLPAQAHPWAPLGTRTALLRPLPSWGPSPSPTGSLYAVRACEEHPVALGPGEREASVPLPP